MLEIWNNHYLKKLYRFQIIFQNTSIYIDGALKRVISYLSNFSAFSSSICRDPCNENLIADSLRKIKFLQVVYCDGI